LIESFFDTLREALKEKVESKSWNRKLFDSGEHAAGGENVILPGLAVGISSADVTGADAIFTTSVIHFVRNV